MVVDTQTRKDLICDFNLLEYLFSDAAEKLETYRDELNLHRKDILGETAKNCKMIVETLHIQLDEIASDMSRLKKNVQSGEVADRVLIDGKRSCFDRLRSLVGVLGAAVTATHWQSPSYSASVCNQAGTQAGGVVANDNDYKRDQHMNEWALETALKKEYFQTPFFIPRYLFVTASGMAAYSVAASYALETIPKDSTVLMGQGVYFENKEMLTSMFGERIVEVNEFDTKHIIAEINTRQPGAVFLDTLGNDPTVAVPDTSVIISHLAHSYKKPCKLILDNSGLSVSYNPLKGLMKLRPSLEIIGVESLNKYAQFGLDRVTGGVVWGTGFRGIFLYDYRRRLGVNISDVSSVAFPKPNRKELTGYLARLERNAMYVANVLSQTAVKQRLPITLVYPGLPMYPGYRWTKNMPFHGSFCMVQYRDEKKALRWYRKVFDASMTIARRENIPFIGGTSFGLPVTRMYIVGKRSKFVRPFLRISAGSETSAEIERIVVMLSAAIQNTTV